ncbi:hypothetical protein [Pseudochryseolinea flava]|uniref:EF-hand domain-containing protein n=1 Tax=Pseudochryseolinea flava TaxID=2059302 RepID=A0A364Y1L2_9BACT|nr:hypothetical protein [Pseudochryseolinea flava]RAV99986.1 hypothetical protein DQQ10_15625 [Pseudochryseolinea flava]
MSISKFELLLCIAFLSVVFSCSEKYEEKGFAVSASTSSEDDTEKPDGIANDSLILQSQPTDVLLTGYPQYRLTTIYKINYRRDSTTYIGENDYYGGYEGDRAEGNAWHYNFMPGLEALTGYNMINVSHFNAETNASKNLFEKPVLMRTLYYPSFSKDTLNYQPVRRNYFLASVYDEDTNKDGFINIKDLRRLYYFDINGSNKKALIPMNYSVVKSQYDQGIDRMYVFARLDADANGKVNKQESIHIFWVDLKNPLLTGRQY